ncbi:class D sortase [Desmospora activa]|uniref:LPXTG-site transpeptidase (Sortase) family protein n=1 Tax=Desmospora activa DSM 45169 TaxID=1121389 RepID=A0A2T4YZR5_9BACL|nr:class D sortase [Desmospora activa]PTM52711.1 LPXTG-site transpeptidase (sortase) family protein [Desmospora activa DSM 45169]
MKRLFFWSGIATLAGGCVLIGMLLSDYKHDQRLVEQFYSSEPKKTAGEGQEGAKPEPLKLPPLDTEIVIEPDGHLSVDVVTIDTATSSQEEEPSTLWKDPPNTGDKVGTLNIPRIQAEIPIWEGTRDHELDRGLGRHESTHLPGLGVTVLAGHRETAMAKAGEIEEGDELIIETAEGTFRYKVFKLWVADADDRTVVVPSDEQVLKVYTCWPLWAGADTEERYVIEAKLVE